MDFKQGFNRDQLQMLSYDNMVSANSWARVVDIFVDILPLESLGFNTNLASEGSPPYHSSDLLKLYLYGYKNSIRSSRKLSKACKINIEVIWLLKGLHPSARTIAYFRKDNSKAFKKAFRYFVGLLKDWKLIDGKCIAIDSFKIRAQNSLKNNFNQKKIDRHITYIDSKIAEYQHVLDQEDSDLISSKITQKQAKKKEYLQLQKQLQQSEQTQLSTTDPDARSVVLHRNIVNVGYNIQAGCDAKHKLFINNDTGAVNDTHALANMALDAKALLQPKTMDVLADKGYTTGKHIQRCSDNGIATYCSPKAHSSTKNGLYDMQVFLYNKDDDTYRCPNNKTLISTGNVYHKGNHRVKHYKNFKACKNCILRTKCTKAKNGRLIERSIYQEALEANANRVNNNPEYYKLRQQITEHQFGTIKRQWGFTYTLMKGKQNVLSEVNLIMICYNLRRLISILGIDQLKMKLRRLYLYYLGLLKVRRSVLRHHFVLQK